MTDVAVDRLLLRGPHARRLTAVAAGPLPAALEDALADVGDVVVDRVSVTLELDVDGYDDATLAILWADAIRAGVLAARTGPPRAAVRSAVVAPLPRPLRGTAEVLAAARTWLAAGEPGLPPTLLALGDPSVARAVAAAAGPEEWALLISAVERQLGLVPAHDPAVGQALDVALPESDEAPAGALPVDRENEAPPSHARPEPTRPGDPPRRRTGPDRELRIQQVVATVAALAEAAAIDVDPATLTHTAGLVLLYPWLAEHCRRAEDLHPGLDPVDVREAALAALVDDTAGATDDPLVALLAGRPGPVSEERSRLPLPLPRAAEVAESARGVLRAFAVLLPGFEESSPAFVRDAWIVRLGLVDRSRDPVLLTATTHPLDVLLPLLPYPVGLVKLPWTPPLSVRFRP